MQYRKEIDGLRALAVVPVVLFHAGLPGFTGGFVGVDVFFVISGYLITGILYREVQEDRFSILAFYERRIRRIFPALFAMLAGVMLLGIFILLPQELVAVGRSVVATTLFYSNVQLWAQSGYFDADAITKPLLHTWSLAVEEQFYLLFPLVLWAICHWWRRSLIAVVAAGAALSLLLSIFATTRWPEASFYLLPTRAWELLIGSLIAVVPATAPSNRRAREVVAMAGVVAIFAAVFFFSDATPFPGAAAMLPVFGTAAIICCAPGTLVGRSLSLAPFVGIGRISYSLYLWHWPLLSYANIETSGNVSFSLRVILVAASFGLAGLSWFFVEEPFRRRAVGRAVLRFGLGCLALGVSSGVVVAALDGFPSRYPGNVVALLNEVSHDTAQSRRADACAVDPWDGDPTFGPCPMGDVGLRPEFVVLGDSYGQAMRPGIIRAFQAEGLSGVAITSSGCPPAFDFGQTERCLKRLERIAHYLDQTRPAAVVLVGSWYRVLHQRDTVYRGRLSHDESTRLENLRDALAQTISTLHGYGTRVGFVFPPPVGKANVPLAIARHRMGIEWTAAEQKARSIVLKNTIAQLGVDAEVDLADAFCDMSFCRVRDESGSFYVDGTHVSGRGAQLIEPKFRQMLRALKSHPGA